MKRTICLMLGALLLSAFIGACGGGGGGAPPPTVGPTPPAPAAQNPGGVWDGQSVAVAAADVFTSFEFNAAGPFTDSSWASPYTATFSAGQAETRNNADLYSTGDFAWHVPSSATVTFETLPSTLTFDVRTEFAGDVSEITIRDENGAVILPVVAPTNNFQMISVVRGAGETLIGSVDVTSTSGGDVIIDDLTFGYSGSGFVGGTDDIACLVADTLVAGNRDIVCVLSDLAGDLLASAQGTLQVTNTNQVSGSGTLYAVPGSVLADGKTVANLTISGGSVIEGDTLNLTIEAAGTTSTVLITFDPIYDRGSDLATVAGMYNLDIFGDLSVVTIDATTGAIFAQSMAGCMLSGEVTIDNATFNVYNVALIVTNVAACGVPDGMYNGLGATQDDGAVLDDFFVFAVFTNLSSVVGVAEKQ